MRRPTDRAIAYANWLESLVNKNNLGQLAALRRGLMHEEDQMFALFSYIPPNFLAGLTPGWEEQCFLMVASLFSFHPKAYPVEELLSRRRNLGDSLRQYAMIKHMSIPIEQKKEEGDDLPETIKRRFEVLISSPRSELLGHLRQTISLLKSEEIPVDWAQLLSDLLAWDWQRNPVQWSWSRSFFVGHYDKEGENNNVS